MNLLVTVRFIPQVPMGRRHDDAMTLTYYRCWDRNCRSANQISNIIVSAFSRREIDD